MGYDERHQSSSSGAAVAIVVAVLLVAIIGVLALAGAWLFVVRTDGVWARPAWWSRLSRGSAVFEEKI